MGRDRPKSRVIRGSTEAMATCTTTAPMGAVADALFDTIAAIQTSNPVEFERLAERLVELGFRRRAFLA